MCIRCTILCEVKKKIFFFNTNTLLYYMYILSNQTVGFYVQVVDKCVEINFILFQKTVYLSLQRFTRILSQSVLMRMK